jgi:NAD(P)H-hydrate epimerase
LLRTDTAAIQADRIAAVTELVRLYGGAVVLKGRNTLIASADSGTTVIPAGNPGMASAGMGDVLTGIIAGVLAQTSGRNLVGAAAAGAYVHACAGDAAAKSGERGIIATDLLTHLKPCLNDSG